MPRYRPRVTTGIRPGEEREAETIVPERRTGVIPVDERTAETVSQYEELELYQ
jgi:hypothetical protein